MRIEPTFLTLLGGAEPTQPAGVTPEGFEELLALFWGEGASPPRGSPPPVLQAGAEEASLIQPNAEGQPPDLTPNELGRPVLDGDDELSEPLPPLEVVYAGLFATAPLPVAPAGTFSAGAPTGLIAGVTQTPVGPANTWRLAPPPTDGAPVHADALAGARVALQPPQPPTAPIDDSGVPYADEAQAAKAPTVVAMPPVPHSGALTSIESTAPAPSVAEALAARRPEVMALAAPLPREDERDTTQSGPVAPSSPRSTEPSSGQRAAKSPPSDLAPANPSDVLDVEAPGTEQPQAAQAPVDRMESGTLLTPEAEAVPSGPDSGPPGPVAQAPQTQPAKPLAPQPGETERPVSAEAASRAIQTVVDRIEDLAAERPRGTVVVRLDPPELGTVTLTIHQFGPRFDADIAASNDALRAALEQNRGQLGQAIEQKGLQLGALRFEAPAPSPGFGQPHQGAPDHTAQQDANRFQNLVRDPEPHANLADWRPLATDGLDLRL